MVPIDILKKVSDEGSRSPFRARIFPGMLAIRDQLFLTGLHGDELRNRRQLFDEKFGTVYHAAQATRDAAIEINRLIIEHSEAIQTSRAIRFEDAQLYINENIDTPLRQATDKLLNQAIVATKSGLQRILKNPLGLDISFLFQKEENFRKGIGNLRRSGETELADYLVDIRSKWLWDLIGMRDNAEHKGWELPEIIYEPLVPSRVEIIVPEIAGVRVDIFARQTANRVLLFTENMMVHAMARNMPEALFVVEIPLEERNPEDPVRFAYGGVDITTAPRWTLQYQDDMDFV